MVAVDIFEEEKRAVAHVEEHQLSLAIGKRGQNVRLAAKLTGWRIDIVKAGEATVVVPATDADETAEAMAADDKGRTNAVSDRAADIADDTKVTDENKSVSESSEEAAMDPAEKAANDEEKTGADDGSPA